MPSCQAINCTNARGKCEKSFFEIPDPTKSNEKRRLCKLWIDHLRNDKLNISTFVWSRSRVVCQDHFEDACFERNLMAESLGHKRKLTLKPGSIPSIVKPGPGVKDRTKRDRTSTKLLLEKRKKAQLRNRVTAFVGENEDDIGTANTQCTSSSGIKRKKTDSSLDKGPKDKKTQSKPRSAK